MYGMHGMTRPSGDTSRDLANSRNAGLCKHDRDADAHAAQRRLLDPLAGAEAMKSTLKLHAPGLKLAKHAEPSPGESYAYH